MAMHPEFPDWYAPAGIQVTPELMQARWAAVEALAGSISGEVFEACVSVIGAVPDAEARARAILFIHKHDQTIATKGNDLEVQIMCGAILRQTLGDEDDFGIASALALACTAFGRTSSAAAPHESAALNYLARASASQRQDRVVHSTIELPENLSERFSETVMSQPANAAKAIVGAISEVVTNANEVVEALVEKVTLQQEELNLLWWRQNMFSRALNAPFGMLSRDTACLLFPGELGDLTVRAPGPSAIAGLIASALDACAPGKPQSSIQSAVNSLKRDWRQAASSRLRAVIASTTPLHLALAKSLATAGTDDWLPVYAVAGGIDPRQEHDQLHLALQFYRERMLFSAMERAFE